MNLLYLGDMISAGGSGEESIVARITCCWKKFKKIMPVLASQVYSLHTNGKLKVCNHVKLSNPF